MEQSSSKRLLGLIWKSTGEHAIWIFYAINALLTVSDTTLLYLTIITALAIIIYYVNSLFVRYRTSDIDIASRWRVDWGIFWRKIQHITESNSIVFACGIAALSYLDGQLFINSTILTSLGFTLHYIHSYTVVEPHTLPDTFPHSLAMVLTTIWQITEEHILTVIGTASLLLYVTGTALIETAIILGIGFVLFYVDQYKAILASERADA